MFWNSTWENAKPGQNVKVEMETNKSSKSIDLYADPIKTNCRFFETFTVGHIPKEILCHCYFFIKKTGTPHPKCLQFLLEVRLLLMFTIECKRILKLMRDFFKESYDHYFTGEIVKMKVMKMKKL